MAEVIDEYRPLDSLVQNPANYNRHDERQIERMAEIIRHNAFTAPFVVNPDGLLLGGHLRRLGLLKLRAESYPEPQGVQAGWLVPCRVFRGNAVQERALLVSDNPDPAQLDYDGEALASLLTELQGEGALQGTWYQEADLERLLGELSGVPTIGPDRPPGGGGGVDPQAEWEGMPEYVHDDKRAFQSLTLHFKDQEAVAAFAALVGQKITPHTRFLWYPEIEIERYADKRYAAEVSGFHSDEGALGVTANGQGA